jgi:O-methyltransferase involved in polyketide biosynthesis
MQSEKVHFTKVQETLLVTLYFRALDSRSKNPILHDKAAEDAVSRIDYDFRKVKLPQASALGMVIRAKQLDRWTAAFLAEHPDATVLHLGCGLDSRVERIDPPKSVRWYDLDYPEVIEVRRRIYPPRDGYSLIGSEVRDPSFLDQIRHDKPAMIVAEGLFMYLSDLEVKDLLQRLTDHFKSGQVAFDAHSRLSLRLAKLSPAIAKLGVEVRWGINDPRELEQWVPRLQLVKEVAVTETPEIARLSWTQRALSRMTNQIPALRRLERYLLYRFE